MTSGPLGNGSDVSRPRPTLASVIEDDEDYQQTLRDRAEGAAEAAKQPKESVADVRDIDADGVPCRLYRPDREIWRGPGGLIVHFHGGGFVFHDVETHDAPARRLANRTGMSVLSVRYRLAPEDPFPAARDDVDTVVAWLARQPQHGRLFAHGDSAGGNLALVAALRHPGVFDGLVLLYPFLDPTSGFGSYDLATTWDREEAQWYWQQYLHDGADPADPDVAPLNSPHLATLPPTLVITAEDDIVRDEGEHLATVLKEKGVRAQAVRYLGVPHSFWRTFEEHPESDLAMRQTGAFLAGLGARG